MESKKIISEYQICNIDELNSEYRNLIEVAKSQVEKAYAPYSEFHVGAAIQLSNNEIFAGSNQENSAYPSGLCAERVALFFANAQYPDVAVKTMAIAAHTKGSFLAEPITPCGSCRQVILETEQRFEKAITILLYGTNHVFILNNIKQLLPLCFEKQSLQK